MRSGGGRIGRNKRISRIIERLDSEEVYFIRSVVFDMGSRVVKDRRRHAEGGTHDYHTISKLIENSMPIDDPEEISILDSIITEKGISLEDLQLLEMDVMKAEAPTCIRVQDPDTGEHRVCYRSEGKEMRNRNICIVCDPTVVTYFRSDEWPE